MQIPLLATVFVVLTSAALAAAPSPAPPVDSLAALPNGTLMNTTRNFGGQRITVPVHPQLRVAVFTDPAGWHSRFHLSHYPRYVYVLEGTLTVEDADGSHHAIPAGRFYAEMTETWRRGENLGPGPLKFLVIDQTEPGTGPNMIMHKTKP